MKKSWILLSLIILLAAVLRLWQLGVVPISPDWDEAALGYNAYSIMQTGRDEYGQFLPIVLRSFDDYKPALYSYFIIPFLPIFDLTIIAVRLPSVLFGILTVIGVFFLVKELFKKDSLALLSAFILSISPWHIQFSRIGFESNVGLALNVFAALFFIKGLRKPWLLSLSAIFASLALYVYQSEKVFTPLLLLSLIVIYRKNLFTSSKKYLTTAVILGLVISLPIVWNTFTNHESLARARGVSIFSQPPSFLQQNSERMLVNKSQHNISGYIFDNRRLLFAQLITANYLSHFNLNWLFITGDNARHHAPNMGLLYLFDLPFLLIGIYQLLFGLYDKRTKIIIFIWLLLAPIPAAVTTGVPHAVRTLNMVPIFAVFIALGVMTILNQILPHSAFLVTEVRRKKYNRKFKYVFLFIILLFFILNFSYFLDQYFIQQNYYTAYDWQYGYAKIIPEITKIEGNYKQIIVSNQQPLDQSYMFFLFYLKYPPQRYQNEDPLNSGGFGENHAFGKYIFRSIDWSKEKKKNDILYIGRPADFPPNIRTILTVRYPNGEKAMEMVKGE